MPTTIERPEAVTDIEVRACYLGAGGAGDVELKLAERLEGEKQRFTMLANSGKPFVHWLFGDYAVDLDGLDVPKQTLPVLRDHDTRTIIGHTDRIEKTADGLRIEGVLYDTPDAAEVVRLSKDGFPWEASIYPKALHLERVAEGQTVKVNGHTLAGPGAVLRKALLREASFTAVGADSNTNAEALADRRVSVEVTGAGAAPGEPAEPANVHEPRLLADPVPEKDGFDRRWNREQKLRDDFGGEYADFRALANHAPELVPARAEDAPPTDSGNRLADPVTERDAFDARWNRDAKLRDAFEGRYEHYRALADHAPERLEDAD